MVFCQKSIKNLDAVTRADGPSLHLSVCMETMGWIDVRPAIGVEDRVVEFDVDIPHPLDVLIALHNGVR